MSDFVQYLHEVFHTFGAIHTKRMFGGYGVYHDGLMFGLVADDVLYLKVDDEVRQTFVERGLTAFEYTKNGKTMKMSYFTAPEEIYDDEAVAREWGVLAFGAALRSQPKSRKRREPTRR